MSKGVAHDPVCDNQTAAIAATPLAVATFAVPLDPVCRLVTPTTGDQTAAPPAPPSH